MLKKRTSIHDVAAASRVSHQTVSRVLNNHKNVSPKTRARVLEAIASLDYKPNLAARALSNGRTMTIGVLSYDSTLFGPASMLHAVQNAAREVGYSVSLASVKSTEQSQFLDRGKELVSSGIDGLILITPIAAVNLVNSRTLSSFPLVVVESEVSGKIPSVNVDQFLGAQMAVKHLLSLGHQKIAHIAGPDNWYESKRRLDGWKSALLQAGFKNGFAVKGDWSARSGYRSVDKILQEGDFTAIFAANDSMALGALKRLRELGKRVPEDISIIGFDDISESEYFTPSLTTVRQDFEKVGEIALELLIDAIEKRDRSTFQIQISPELLVRESTTKVGFAGKKGQR